MQLRFCEALRKSPTFIWIWVFGNEDAHMSILDLRRDAQATLPDSTRQFCRQSVGGAIEVGWAKLLEYPNPDELDAAEVRVSTIESYPDP